MYIDCAKQLARTKVLSTTRRVSRISRLGGNTCVESRKSGDS